MDDKQLLDGIKEFVKRQVDSAQRDEKYDMVQAVSDYFSGGDFSLTDHMDTYDLKDQINSWMDDNASDIILDTIRDSTVEYAIRGAINDRDLTDDVSRAIFDNIDSVLDHLDYKALAKALIAELKETNVVK